MSYDVWINNAMECLESVYLLKSIMIIMCVRAHELASYEKKKKKGSSKIQYCDGMGGGRGRERESILT